MFQRANKFIFLFIFQLIFLHSVTSQQSISFQDYAVHFRQAKEYFDAKNFVAAKEEFLYYLNSLPSFNQEQDGQKVLAEYYITMCSLYMSQPESELYAQRFIQDHPEHPQALKLLRGIGLFFYENGDYDRAIKYLAKSSQTNEEAKYKLAVSYYETKSLKNALDLFLSLKNSPNEEYSFNSAYYAGVINFGEKRYNDAIEDFKKAEGKSNFRAEIPNWISMSLFHQGKFNEMINFAESILSKPNSDYRIDDIAILVAEVQYKLGYYNKASKNYEKAFNIVPESKNDETKFHYGFSLYKTNQFSKAYIELKELSEKKDSVGQIAAFTVGLAQLKAGNLEATMDAFKNAKELNFNAEIKEEASFNYAKVLLDIGRAGDCLSSLADFNVQFPESKFLEESYLVASEAILSGNNLKAAVNYLASVAKKTPELNLAYQKLCYNLGVKAYNQNLFQQSLELMNEAINNDQDIRIKVLATFAKAEIFSQNKRFKEAVEIYNPLLLNKVKLEEIPDFDQQVRLSLAYAYFNLADFTKANALFKTYVDKLLASGKSNSKNPNVILRLADTYLINKKYNDALNYYQQAYNELDSEKDYALYQIGLTLNYLNRGSEAIAAFKRLKKDFPKSSYLNNALYQENLTAFNTRQYEDAIEGFTYIIENLKSNAFFYDALLYRAQSYMNLRNHEKAIEEFKSIILKYPTQDVARDALYGLQEELNEVGRANEFTEILMAFREKSGNRLNASETEELEYSTAKNIYLGTNFVQSIEPLMAFLEKYPNTKHQEEAIYLIADAAYRGERFEIARDYYLKVLSMDENHPQAKRFFERIAKISYDLKDYSMSIQALKRLQLKDLNPQESLLANNGLVNNYIALNRIDSASIISNEVIQLNTVSDLEKAELSSRMAKGFEDLAKVDDQKFWLRKVVAYDKAELGAQAQYQLAVFLQQEGKYQESIDMIIEKFQNDYAEASEIIVAKAFILLADNFVGLKNIPQALATLNSIIENSENEEVKALAQNKLTEISNLPINNKEE